MNKVATYLNEHLSGEVLTHGLPVVMAEQDGGILSRKPEMVVRPAGVNDIRKVMKFCSQLADKGHVLSVSVRGSGTDSNGGSLGRGVIIDTSVYMKNVLGIDPKQQLIHVQAGISQSAVKAALVTHKGLGISNSSYTGEDGTVAGSLSTMSLGSLSAMYGTVGDSVQQLEVILSSGELLQTGRISRRELNKKKGLASFEGEIYRQIDSLIEDNQELIDQINIDKPDTAGYANIAKVKKRDGSFDLTPLFVGSQGSLGIISEVILKARFDHPEFTVVTAAYSDISEAYNAIDIIRKTDASVVELIDGQLLARSAQSGKMIDWAPQECYTGGVVVAVFNAFSDRARHKAANKLIKKLDNSASVKLAELDMEAIEFESFHSMLSLVENPSQTGVVVPGVFSGVYVPQVRLGSFLEAIKSLESSHGVKMPFFVDINMEMINFYPEFSIKKISDRQKILKLCADLAKLISAHEGSFAGYGGEGRLKAAFIQPHLSKDEIELYAKIKHIFDPNKLLNPGIKTLVPAKELATELNEWCRARL